MRIRGHASSIGGVVAILMVAFLAYVAGAWAAWRGDFPFDPVLRQAFLGTTAVVDQYVVPKDPLASDVWMEQDSGHLGVLTHDPKQAYDGYTLVTTGQQALLLNMDGTAVHRWNFPYERLHAAAPAEAEPDLPEDWVFWRPARLLPDGDLIVGVGNYSTTPSGLALIKLDAQSRLIWAYRNSVHHDFDVDEAGNIYVLDQRIRAERPPRLWALQEPFLDERVVVLSSDGRELRRVSIMDAFDRSEYRTMINRLARNDRGFSGDYLHTNNVELVSAELADAFPFLDEGQVLLSMRELDTIAALDLDRGQIVWAMRGPWHRQHDPDLLANGNIMLFDNQGDWARGGRSRVIELDPEDGRIVWSYPSAKGGQLWSHYRAGQQVLPNGNVLINEFMQGRLLEVTREGDLVWEFVTPFRHEDHDDYVARIMFGERYSREWISFEPTPVAESSATVLGESGWRPTGGSGGRSVTRR